MALIIEKVRSFQELFRWRKKDILVVVGWASAIALVIIKTYWFFYLENPRFFVNKDPYCFYDAPFFTTVDALLLLFLSFSVGLVLADVKTVVYGYFASTCLSASVAVAYVSCYIWFVLGLQESLSTTPFGWEWALFLAFFNVLRFIFPTGMALCLIGVVTGSFLTRLIET